MLIAYLALVTQELDQRIKQKLRAGRQALTAKPRYFMVVGRFCSIEQPDEIDIAFAGAFDIPAGIDAFHVGIQENLEKCDRMGCGLATKAFVSAPQRSQIHLFHCLF